MGQESCRAVVGADDLELVATVDPRTAGIDLRQVLGGEVPAIQIAGHVEALEAAGVDVVVDFTTAAAARDNLAWYAANGIHAVVGTTGLSGGPGRRRGVVPHVGRQCGDRSQFRHRRGAAHALLRARRPLHGGGGGHRAASRREGGRPVRHGAPHGRAHRRRPPGHGLRTPAR